MIIRRGDPRSPLQNKIKLPYEKESLAGGFLLSRGSVILILVVKLSELSNGGSEIVDGALDYLRAGHIYLRNQQALKGRLSAAALKEADVLIDIVLALGLYALNDSRSGRYCWAQQ